MAHIQVANLEVVDQMIDAAQFEQEKMRGGGDRITFNPNGTSVVEIGVIDGPRDEFYRGTPSDSYGPYGYGQSFPGGYRVYAPARIPIPMADIQYLSEVEY